MPSLDALIGQWTEQLRASHPDLIPHLDEFADHVRSSAQARIDGGASAEHAFAASLGSFGAPEDLGGEFHKNAVLLKGKERAAVGTYLLMTAIFTGAVVLVDWRFDLGNQALSWLLLVWVFTTALHDVLLRRARHGLAPA